MNRKNKVLLVILLPLFLLCGSSNCFSATLSKNEVVVVLIDMQRYFMDRFQNDEAENIVIYQQKIIAHCVKNDIPLIVLEYQNENEKTGATIPELGQFIERVPRKFLIKKTGDNGFFKTTLKRTLKKLQAKTIFFMGVNADSCVQSTAVNAIKNGYQIATCRQVVASSHLEDEKLKESGSWYKENGLLFEDVPSFLESLK